MRERGFAYGYGPTTGCRAIRLVAGDALDVRMYQASGNNVTTAPNPYWDWLTIEEVLSTAAIENTAQVTVPNATFVKVPYANEVFDDASQFDPANSRFTAAQAGDYQICASMDLGSNDSSAELDVYINNKRERPIAFGVGVVTGCRTVRLAANDAVEVWLYQDSGATVTIQPDSSWDWLEIQSQPATVSAVGIASFSAPGPNTFEKLSYASELFDDHGEFDIGSSTFTAASAGDYQLCASLFTGTSSYGDELDVYKNGVREVGIGYSKYAQRGCRTLRLASNDQLQVWYANTAAASVDSDTLWDWIELSKLR